MVIIYVLFVVLAAVFTGLFFMVGYSVYREDRQARVAPNPGDHPEVPLAH